MKPTESHPPRSIAELEKTEWRWQFGLSKLMLASNLLGIAVAVLVSTRGYALYVAWTLGIIAVFLAPMLVLLYIVANSAWQRLVPRSKSLKFEASKRCDPFDEL